MSKDYTARDFFLNSSAKATKENLPEKFSQVAIAEHQIEPHLLCAPTGQPASSGYLYKNKHNE